MKTGLALSVQQPWAWLIVNGYKDIENREWYTKVRGIVGIHAGKKFDRAGYDHVRRTHPDIPMPQPDEFEMGGIVGRTEILDCVTSSPSKWFAGRFGFVLNRSQSTTFPMIPCRGMLGFFKPALPEPVKS